MISLTPPASITYCDNIKVKMERNINLYSKINNVLLYCVLNESIRNLIGLRQFSRYTKNMGWCIWLNNFSGVHDLFPITGEYSNSGHFWIKYYPALEEPIFNEYSDHEKSLRLRHPFEKGIPKQEIRDTELADAFIVGRLDILWEEKAIWLLMNLPGDEQELTPYGDRLHQTDKQNSSITHVNYQLYASLIRGFCLFMKTPPSLVIMKTISNPPENKTDSDEIGQHGLEKGFAHQMICVLLPDTENKNELIEEICTEIGFSNGNNVIVANPNTSITLLHKNGKNLSKNPASIFLDKMWWELPLKAESILPEEKYTI